MQTGQTTTFTRLDPMPRPSALPPDCRLLPLTSGALLVSAGHAVFCPVRPAEVDTVQRLMAGAIGVAAIGDDLPARLRTHGFFDPPREPAPDLPTVQLQITNACNIGCKYCCTNSGRPRSSELGYERMFEIVQQIPAALGVTARVAILGGEPLLVPWAIDLANDILDAGLKLTLFTNGMPLADARHAENVARLTRRGAEVRVSLGGPSPGTCDPISEASRFETAIAGINTLARFGGKCAVDLVLTPGHVDATVENMRALRARLPPGTPLALGILYHSGRETGAHLFAGKRDLETALDRIAFETGETVPASPRSPLASRREACACALGRHIHVRSDGALFTCFKMEEQVGHIDDTGFVAAALQARSSPHRAADSPTCSACPLVTICGGGCRSENLLYTGDPDRPPCGEWRVRTLSELLAEDQVGVVDWPVAFLLDEARRRGFGPPDDLKPVTPSRHLLDVS